MEEITQRQFTDLEWQFAQRCPRELLENLPNFQGSFIEQALEQLRGDRSDSKTVSRRLDLLRQHPFIQDILSFLAGLTPTVVSTDHS